MNDIVFLIILVGLSFFTYKIYLSLKEEKEKNQNLIFEQLNKFQNSTQDQLNKINEVVYQSSNDSNKILQKQFQENNKVIQEITKELTKIKSTNDQVLDFTSNLQKIEKIFSNPKHRGIVGEYFLETLLAQVFHANQYELQHKLEDGLIVDAVIFFKELKIPIDAKFSLDNFNKIKDSEKKDKLKNEKKFIQDIKKRIDETSRYIKTSLGTTNFAFMFIPAEGVFHYIISAKIGSSKSTQKNLIEYAYSKNVIMVSPTSFYAYLETVIQGLKAVEMENNVTSVLKKIETLSKHLSEYNEGIDKLGKNLEKTVKSFNTSYRKFKKLDKDIYNINGSKFLKNEVKELEENTSVE